MWYGKWFSSDWFDSVWFGKDESLWSLRQKGDTSWVKVNDKNGDVWGLRVGWSGDNWEFRDESQENVIGSGRQSFVIFPQQSVLFWAPRTNISQEIVYGKTRWGKRERQLIDEWEQRQRALWFLWTVRDPGQLAEWAKREVQSETVGNGRGSWGSDWLIDFKSMISFGPRFGVTVNNSIARWEVKATGTPEWNRRSKTATGWDKRTKSGTAWTVKS